MKFNAVIFDLDGTLIDTIEDIKDSLNIPLQKAGFPIYSTDSYYYLVGDGIREMVEKALPENKKKLTEEFVEKFREEYQQRWKLKSHLYSGISEMLNSLFKMNFTIGILSNKPDDFAKIMVKTLLPEWNFSVVRGHQVGVPIKPHPASSLKIIRELNLQSEKTIFVGDSNIDIFTAKEVGFFPVGVSWGYRTEQELLNAGAKLILNKPNELIQFLTN